MLRSPICSVIGHIDHGKTSVLDKIRGTSIAKGEAGGITQCISSTCISIQVINKVCEKLLKTLKKDVKVPGILFIDTPGHAAFNNMRKLGGNLSDIAILVIDVTKGFEEQSLECIEVLKHYKTPFVIAANKIDVIAGWRADNTKTLIQNINDQNDYVKSEIDKRIYTMVGKLSELGFNAERFDRIEDYTKQVAIIPTSAKTGEGIPELLIVLIGLAEKFLETSLKVNKKAEGEGVILEVKEEKGLGKVFDTIIYNGKIKVNDTIVIAGIEKPIVTKIKALITPKGSIKQAEAAIGVRISALDTDNVYGGMPLKVANKTNLEEIKQDIQKEVEKIIQETEEEGIIIKADTLGSLDALTTLLKEKNIPINSASIGNVTKKDVANANAQKEITNKVVLGFNIKCEESAEVKVILSNVIYHLIEDYEKWKAETEKKLEDVEFEKLVRPCKLQIMRHCVFRQSNPAIVGISVLSGVVKVKTPLIKRDGSDIGRVKSIQLEKENISSAEKGKEVAISLPKATVGRQINEDDILYSNIPEEDFIKLKKLKKYLKEDELKVLREIADIKRKENPVWGV